jgi:ABC-type glycerol-3-phosphate transport system substrate-binding protein
MKKILNHGAILLLAVAIASSGLSCRLFQTNVLEEATKKTTLEYWGVWHNNDELKPAIDQFRKLHGNVVIKYKKFRLDEYKQKLLEAWAEDKGPDIYQIPAGWITEFQNRITPAPKIVKLFTLEQKAALGKVETIATVKNENLPGPTDIKNQFVDIVYKDVVRNNKIYGLPLSVDSLVLYYNRTILDNARIATPPSTWTDLVAAVKAIAKLQPGNIVVQSAVALGTTNNIPRAVDIISTIMQQNGAIMNKNNRAAFAETNKNNSPALDAINFYKSFAEPLSEVYNWNDKMPDALEAFIAGKTAMFYGYSYQLPIIKGRAPKLDLGIAPMTQVGQDKPINMTNYWVETVSHKSKNVDAAWGFVSFLTGQEQAKIWAEKTGRPAAQRSILAGQKQNPSLAIFADQALTASRWYYGKDEAQMEQYFIEMIEQVANKQAPGQAQEAINLGVRRINENW